MKTETRNLSEVVRLALQKRTLIPVGHTEIANALSALHDAVKRIACNPGGEDPATAAGESLDAVYNLLYLLGNKIIDPGVTAYKALFTQAMHLRKELLAYSNEHTNEPQIEFEICNSKQLLTRLSKLHTALKQNAALAPLYTCLQAELEKTLTTKYLSFHRWRWWSQFVACCQPVPADLAAFTDLLITLNFNTPGCIRWLCDNVSAQMEETAHPAGKCECVTSLLAKFENSSALTPGYKPAAVSVKQAMRTFLKRKLFYLVKMPLAQQPPAPGSNAKLNMGLSVPQLALLTRLMLDAKIISEANQSALLKKIAAVVSTSRAAALSFESLRINYYTPGTAAKAIVKEYLLQMIRLINTY